MEKHGQRCGSARDRCDHSAEQWERSGPPVRAWGRIAGHALVWPVRRGPEVVGRRESQGWEIWRSSGGKGDLTLCCERFAFCQMPRMTPPDNFDRTAIEEGERQRAPEPARRLTATSRSHVSVVAPPGTHASPGPSVSDSPTASPPAPARKRKHEAKHAVTYSEHAQAKLSGIREQIRSRPTPHQPAASGAVAKPYRFS